MSQASMKHPRRDPGATTSNPRAMSKPPTIKPNKPMKPQGPKKKSSGGDPSFDGGHGGGGLLSKVFVFFVLLAGLFFLSGLAFSNPLHGASGGGSSDLLDLFISVGCAVLGIMLFAWFIKNKLLRK